MKRLFCLILTSFCSSLALASETSEVNWADPNLYDSPAPTQTSAVPLTSKSSLDVFSVIIDNNARLLVMSFAELESYLSKSMPVAEARKITRKLKRDPAQSSLRGVRVVDHHVELDQSQFETNQIAESEKPVSSQDKLVEKVLNLQQKKSGPP